MMNRKAISIRVGLREWGFYCKIEQIMESRGVAQIDGKRGCACCQR